MPTTLQSRFPWAGLATGPGCWAINTQAGYALVPWVCAHHLNLVSPLAVLLALMSLGGAYLSRSARVVERHGEGPRRFLAGIGMAAGVLFALVILTQGAAGL